MRNSLLLASLLLVIAGCGSNSSETRTEPAAARARARAGGPGQGRCDSRPEGREVSEYDTSGDQVPDVRKVYMQAGDPPLLRLVLICREADLNADGRKDVRRHYNDEGRPLHEEADRNFDGRMDELTFFEAGRIVRQEFDTNADGKVDTKIFFENGKPTRTERDLRGRSTASAWHPDTWEYFEEGRMVRTGTDVDGDGRVDRWDRDETFRRSGSAPGVAGTVSEDEIADQEADGGVGEGGAPAEADAGVADAGRRRRGAR